jgi:hypothetical protein
MLIHWIPLLCGLFFGLIPPRLLLNSECRYLRFDAVWSRIALSKKSSGQRRRRWWKLPLVWIDPIRGYFVATQLSEAFDYVADATTMQKISSAAATAFVLFLVLWVQTCGRRAEGETISPTGFLGGMMIGVLPLVVAISAIVTGVATAIAMNRFTAGYLMATLATAGFGFLFLKTSIWLPVYTLLVAAPLLLSWLRRTSLVMPVRC